MCELEKALDAHPSGGDALAAYSRTRAPEADALVRISRGFDRPGALGFLTFVLPLILDGVFHGAFPKLFAPNTIAMLQKDKLTFVDVAQRKRYFWRNGVSLSRVLSSRDVYTLACRVVETLSPRARARDALAR